MTHDEFIARCETIWTIGLGTDRKLFVMMANWLDFVMRFEHTWFSHGQGQGPTCIDFLEGEHDRIGRNGVKTLAADVEGYNLQKLAAVLCHPCQICAEDPEAWHTRSGFCPHLKREEKL